MLGRRAGCLSWISFGVWAETDGGFSSSGVGVYSGLRQEHLRKYVYLLVSLTACYALYPALSGQFFPYHWLPFVYLIILLSTLCLVEMKWQTSLVLLLVILLSVRIPGTIFRQIEGKPIATASSRASQIALYLGKHLEQGDTVQPLDWTGGTLLAMLETRAHIATPFVFDFYFYHHVSNPYIQDLRTKFINDLQVSSPRFIVEVTAARQALGLRRRHIARVSRITQISCRELFSYNPGR